MPLPVIGASEVKYYCSLLERLFNIMKNGVSLLKYLVSFRSYISFIMLMEEVPDYVLNRSSETVKH